MLQCTRTLHACWLIIYQDIFKATGQNLALEVTEDPGTILYLSPVRLVSGFWLILQYEYSSIWKTFCCKPHAYVHELLYEIYIWRILALELITFSYLHLTLGGVGLGVIGSVMIGYFRLKKRSVRSKMVFCIWLPTRIFKSWILIMISFPYQRGCKNALKLIFYILMTKTIW